MKVLVVDDDEDFRFILIEEFKSAGVEVIEATNGHEGFEILQKQKFDVIFSDVQMPVMNGLDFLKKAVQLKVTAPIYIMSSYTSIKEADFLSAGAKGFLEKPIDVKDFLKKYETLA